MGCNLTKSKEERVYHVAPEADPTNTTSPDIVYKPELVSLDGRANDEHKKEAIIWRELPPASNVDNYNGKCITNNSATLAGVTEQHYLMPNRAQVNNGYATQRSTHLTSSPEDVQPLINSQPIAVNNNNLYNNMNNNTNSFTECHTEQPIPVTEHIIVNFQSTNNSNNNNNNNKNITAVPSLNNQPIIEVYDVINTFHASPDNEYCDSDIVVIPTPQTVFKSRS